jgi:hypothetical protein
MKNLMHRTRPAPSHGLRAGHTGRPCGIGSAEDVLHEELSFVRRRRHHGRHRPHIPLLLASVQRLATSPTKLCVGQGKVNTMTRSSSPTLRHPPSSVTKARSCWCKPRAWCWHSDDLLPAQATAIAGVAGCPLGAMVTSFRRGDNDSRSDAPGSRSDEPRSGLNVFFSKANLWCRFIMTADKKMHLWYRSTAADTKNG